MIMRNPVRRNRNIGTSRQVHGSNNKLTIPQPCQVDKTFTERLGAYEKIDKVINGHLFTFIVEETRSSSAHACSVSDVENMITHIPVSDYGGLKFIVFRQPKRKEEILSPVWERLIYAYEFENEFYPAVILEAANYKKKIHWARSLLPDDQAEFELLKADGHRFIADKRSYIAKLESKSVRNTQLYRTLLHEFGHYVHYLEVVERPGREDEHIDEWIKRNDAYFKIAGAEKERFAHRYARLLSAKLKEQGKIP